MFLTAVVITVIIIIGFIMWYNRKIAEKNRLTRISQERQQGDNLKREEGQRLRAEERAAKNQEERKLRIAQDANAGKVKEERDRKESELRQKIADRKKLVAEEEQRKIDDEKTL